VETQALAAGKKNATRMGAHIVFVDESGFLLIPSVRKTWSPRGQTPLLHHWTWPRHKISVISGISISPVRHRLGLLYALHTVNIATEQVIAFLRELLRHLPGPIILLWDGSKTHKGPRIREFCARHPRLHLERLPPYAPELNPDEGVWSLAKRELANGRPDSLEVLEASVRDSLDRTRHSPSRLNGCLRTTPLKFF
jgi:transposase